MFISTRDVGRHVSLTLLFVAVSKIVMIISKISRTVHVYSPLCKL